jgi:hypothetical protein
MPLIDIFFTFLFSLDTLKPELATLMPVITSRMDGEQK